MSYFKCVSKKHFAFLNEKASTILQFLFQISLDTHLFAHFCISIYIYNRMFQEEWSIF